MSSSVSQFVFAAGALEVLRGRGAGFAPLAAGVAANVLLDTWHGASASHTMPGGAAAALIPSPLEHAADLIARIYAHWGALEFGNAMQLIAESGDNQARQTIIGDMLTGMDLPVENQTFTSPRAGTAEGQMIDGCNLLVDLPAATLPANAPTLMLGAHFDKIGDGSQGALDNAAGCAALIQLAARLKLEPLANCKVKLAFFDQEERGLHGSQAFVRLCNASSSCPELYVNVDMAGGGDVVWAGSSRFSHLHMLRSELPARARVRREELPSETAFIAALQASAQGSSLAITQGRAAVPSDSLSFQRAGLPAVGLGQHTAADIEALERWEMAGFEVSAADPAVDWDKVNPLMDAAEAGDDAAHDLLMQDEGFVRLQRALESYELAQDGLRNSTFGSIHGPADQVALVNPQQAAAFVDLLEAAVRRYDGQLGQA